MDKGNSTWFILERSEALASLMLTARPDLHVRTEKKHDEGVDFLVGLQESGDVPTTKHFIVQVKGTMSSDKTEWAQCVKQLYRVGRAMFLPACVFIVNVRTNDVAYTWLAEPRVEAGSAALNYFDRPDFRTLDESAVDEIVNAVQAWYAAMPRSVASHAS